MERREALKEQRRMERASAEAQDQSDFAHGRSVMLTESVLGKYFHSEVGAAWPDQPTHDAGNLPLAPPAASQSSASSTDRSTTGGTVFCAPCLDAALHNLQVPLSSVPHATSKCPTCQKDVCKVHRDLPCPAHALPPAEPLSAPSRPLEGASTEPELSSEDEYTNPIDDTDAMADPLFRADIKRRGKGGKYVRGRVHSIEHGEKSGLRPYYVKYYDEGAEHLTAEMVRRFMVPDTQEDLQTPPRSARTSGSQ